MQHTSIEWVRNSDGRLGYTFNPITGCLNHVNGLCKGGGFPCYAYKLANTRLKERYLANTSLASSAKGGVMKLGIGNKVAVKREEDYADPFYPRFWEERLTEPCGILKDELNYDPRSMKPKGIFVCDMSDLFGIGIPESWTNQVMNIIKACPWHRFYLLTKQPQNLPKWSPFPENVWLGTTVTHQEAFDKALQYMSRTISEVRFLSFEPLLAPIHPFFLNVNKKANFDWLIIGTCTGTYFEMMDLQKGYPDLTVAHWKGNLWTAQPRIEWVREIVEAADKAGVKVFLKDNLLPLLNPEHEQWSFVKLLAGQKLRQEMSDV